MKKLLLSCLLGTCTMSAYAANTVDLKVTGTLTNSACTPSLSSGSVDFGKNALSNMSATAVNQLGYRDTTLTITCDAATSIAFTATDGRADSLQAETVSGVAANPVIMFGLGKTAAGVKLGAYLLAMNALTMTADGVEYKILYSAADATPVWNIAGAGSYLQPKPNIIYTAGGADKVPVAFKSAAFPLRIFASVQDTTTLAITDDTKLDGLATFSLIYL